VREWLEDGRSERAHYALGNRSGDGVGASDGNGNGARLPRSVANGRGLAVARPGEPLRVGRALAH
jgi:hypothetical protein